MFVLLIYGAINVFIVFDVGSHSASDTLRRFLLTMTPVWLVTLWAARIVFRAR